MEYQCQVTIEKEVTGIAWISGYISRQVEEEESDGFYKSLSKGVIRLSLGNVGSIEPIDNKSKNKVFLSHCLSQNIHLVFE